MTYFLHIAKCGGSTIRNAIRSSLSSRASKSDKRKTIFVYGRQGKMGDLNIHPDDLKGYGQIVAPSQVKSIIGHYSYSALADYLGHYNTYGHAFTLIRHPVKRVISNINYIRASPNHGAHAYYAKFNTNEIFDHIVGAGLGTYMLDMLSLDHEIGDTSIGIIQRIELVLTRINTYRLESYTDALLNHVSPQSEQSYSVINATADRISTSLPINEGFNEQKLLPVAYEDLSDKQIRILQDVFAPDLDLYASAR